MRRELLYVPVMTLLLTGVVLTARADVYDDDIYYDPKKNGTIVTKKNNKQSNYIANFQDIDVDAYNMRGQYYATPVDTIGARVSNEEDFVYTQEIQKYYNPTIVVDNASIVEDILENSYGNVEVIYNINGVPTFSSWGNNWYYPGSRWSISSGNISWDFNWSYPYFSYNWGWAPSWSWGPAWSWNWGPSWGWAPGWSWSWGPSWGWGWNSAWGWSPTWSWNYRPGYTAQYRPTGHRPSSPNPGWGHNTRPGGIYDGSGRPATTPGYSRPGGNVGTSGGNHNSTPTITGRQPGRGYGYVSGTSNDRNQQGSHPAGKPSVGSATLPGSSGHQGGYRVDSDGHRRNTTTTTPSTNSTPMSGNSNRSHGYNSDNRTSMPTRTYNTPSTPSRSSGSIGGSYGGSRGGSSHGGGARGGRR